MPEVGPEFGPEIWIATFNRNKLKEFKDLLPGFTVHAAFEFPAYSAPAETGATFKANALLKAKSLHAVKPDGFVIADDSGLEVEALNGLPGVHSARYAGPKARDIENNLKLLKQLSLQTNGENRQARMCCTLCLIDPNGQEHYFEGNLEGSIARDLRGKSGFGYDPVFVPVGETKTLAELGSIFKNKQSHRALALRQLRDHFSNNAR